MRKDKEDRIDRIYREELSRLYAAPSPGFWDKMERAIPPPPDPRTAVFRRVPALLILLFFGTWICFSLMKRTPLGAFPIPVAGHAVEAVASTLRAELPEKSLDTALSEPVSREGEGTRRPGSQWSFPLALPAAKTTDSPPGFMHGQEPVPAGGGSDYQEPSYKQKLDREALTALSTVPSKAKANAAPLPETASTPPAAAGYPGISYEWQMEWLAPLHNGLGEQLGLEQPNWSGDRRMGLALDFRFSEYWGIRAGLGVREMNLFFRQKERMEYAPGYFADGLFVNQYKYQTSAGLETTSAIGFRQGQSPSSPAPGEPFVFSLEMEQQIGYYTVPIEALYYFGASGLQLAFHGGLAMNGRLWETNRIVEASFSGPGFVHRGTGLNLAGLPRHFLEITSGAGIYYQHHSGVTARLEPGLRYALTPMFNRRGLQGGFMIGIGYHF
ncbi:MAG: hypothetical protein KDD10_25765 [Phaeodactylibacter sp.]|nr:hypothetical protein [Phaeodactylibacter sp.]